MICLINFSSSIPISFLENIEIQIGRTGALTPVAKIKPVNIGGVVVSNATLHNEEEINRKDIRIGDTVLIERAGDVIPHVISVDLKLRNKNSKKFNFPKTCPSCGSKTTKDFNLSTKKEDAVRRCSSEGFYCDKITIEKLSLFLNNYCIKEIFDLSAKDIEEMIKLIEESGFDWGLDSKERSGEFKNTLDWCIQRISLGMIFEDNYFMDKIDISSFKAINNYLDLHKELDQLQLIWPLNFLMHPH